MFYGGPRVALPPKRGGTSHGVFLRKPRPNGVWCSKSGKLLPLNPWTQQALAESSWTPQQAPAESSWTPQQALAESSWTPQQVPAESSWTPHHPPAESSWTQQQALAESSWTQQSLAESSWTQQQVPAESSWTPHHPPAESSWTQQQALAESSWTPQQAPAESSWTQQQALAESSWTPQQALAESSWTPQQVPAESPQKRPRPRPRPSMAPELLEDDTEDGYEWVKVEEVEETPRSRRPRRSTKNSSSSGANGLNGEFKKIPVCQLRHSQLSCKETFQNGRPIKQLVSDLLDRKVSLGASFLTLTVFQTRDENTNESILRCIDNRRLWVLKQYAKKSGKHWLKVNCILFNHNTLTQVQRFIQNTDETDGLDVRLRKKQEQKSQAVRQQ